MPNVLLETYVSPNDPTQGGETGTCNSLLFLTECTQTLLLSQALLCAKNWSAVTDAVNFDTSKSNVIKHLLGEAPDTVEQTRRDRAVRSIWHCHAITDRKVRCVCVGVCAFVPV